METLPGVHVEKLFATIEQQREDPRYRLSPPPERSELSVITSTVGPSSRASTSKSTPIKERERRRHHRNCPRGRGGGGTQGKRKRKDENEPPAGALLRRKAQGLDAANKVLFLRGRQAG